MSSLDKLRTSSFYPVIDRLVNEMTRRFSTEAGAVLMGTSALNPENATFLEKESLEPMAQLYGIKKDDLLAEVHQMRRLLERAGEKNKVKHSAAHWNFCPCLNLTKTPLRTSINFCALLLHCL